MSVGAGLARGLAITLKTMTRPAVTQQYPDVKPDLPPRSRGVIGLFEENCTVCMLCARECPDWCIYIESHKEVVPAREPGARERTRNMLDRFAIDFALCMYCGICIEVCPFDALFWTPEFEYAEYDIADLTHEKERLREWMWTVPAPPAVDPRADEPKELAAAEKSLAKASAAAAGGAAGATGEAVRERPVRRAAGERPARRTEEKPVGDQPASVNDQSDQSEQPDQSGQPAVVADQSDQPGLVADQSGQPGVVTDQPDQSEPVADLPVRDDPTMPSSAEATAEQAGEADSASEPEGGGPV